MSKIIASTKPSNTITISECKDGFWLWDATRKMNLSMRAATSTDALVEALHYYQQRLTQVEQEHALLHTKVDAFVSQFLDTTKD